MQFGISSCLQSVPLSALVSSQAGPRDSQLPSGCRGGGGDGGDGDVRGDGGGFFLFSCLICDISGCVVSL